MPCSTTFPDSKTIILFDNIILDNLCDTITLVFPFDNFIIESKSLSSAIGSNALDGSSKIIN